MYNLYSKYLRHIVLPEFGLISQDVLLKSKILCVGAGGLGSPAITYLAMIGVGNIDIIDYDCVEPSNLNRQFLFKETDINKNKASCAKNYINKLNSNININTYAIKLSHNNCLNYLKGYDAILDCTDNLEVKFLLSDYGIKLETPIIHGAIFGYEGYIAILNKQSLCYRCIYDNITSQQCIDYGVFGPIAGIIGIIQASETIKLLLKQNTSLNSNLLVINIKTLQFNSFKINKKKNCTIC